MSWEEEQSPAQSCLGPCPHKLFPGVPFVLLALCVLGPYTLQEVAGQSPALGRVTWLGDLVEVMSPEPFLLRWSRGRLGVASPPT